MQAGRPYTLCARACYVVLFRRSILILLIKNFAVAYPTAFRTCFGIRSLDIYPSVSNLGYVGSAGIVINKFSVVKDTSITEGHTWYWLCFVNRRLGLYRPHVCVVAVYREEQRVRRSGCHRGTRSCFDLPNNYFWYYTDLEMDLLLDAVT